MVAKKFIDKIAISIDNELNRLIELFSDTSNPEKSMEESFQSLKHIVKQFKDSFFKGYQLVLDNASRGNFHLPQEHYELKPVKNENQSELSIASIHEMAHDSSLQETFHYSPRMMHEIYDLGCEYYQSREFEKCADILLFLVVLNPSIYAVWQVLGSAFEEQNKLQEALYAFSVSINCKPLKIEGYRNAVRCAVKSRELDTAHKLIDYGLDMAKNAEDVKEANALIAGLKEIKLLIK